LDPIVIFLIDGEDTDPRDPVVVVNEMREANLRLQFLTIKFGSEPTDKHLKDMADAGGGKILGGYCESGGANVGIRASCKNIEATGYSTHLTRTCTRLRRSYHVPTAKYDIDSIYHSLTFVLVLFI
jgi:hypothetical protein